MLVRRQIPTRGKGLVGITHVLEEVIAESGLREGLCTVFIRHTSASLTIQENADPAVLADLQAWLERLVPEHDALYTHTEEGPDDMPSHVKAALTSTSIGIPIVDGRAALGTWQGLFLWEHRSAPKSRSLIFHLAP